MDSITLLEQTSKNNILSDELAQANARIAELEKRAQVAERALEQVRELIYEMDAVGRNFISKCNQDESYTHGKGDGYTILASLIVALLPEAELDETK